MENTILDNLVDEREIDLTPASTGKRFLNYLIDVIAYYFVVIVIVMGTIFSGNQNIAEEAASESLLANLVALLLFFGYYTVMEATFDGKTLGKFITRTRAVRDDGSALGWDKAALRSICRFIPFEPFSLLGGGRGWHDSIAKTVVVND